MCNYRHRTPYTLRSISSHYRLKITHVKVLEAAREDCIKAMVYAMRQLPTSGSTKIHEAQSMAPKDA
jgi:hypothetical protein